MTMLDQEMWVVCPEGPPACRFSKVQAAIDAAPEGATIAIKSGTYEENLIVRKSLTIQAAEGEQVVVKSARESLPTLLLVNGRPIHVEVRGLTIKPARQHQGNGIEIMGMVAARIERNTIQDYQWGILVLGTIGQLGLSDLPVVIHENTIHSSIWIRQSATVAVSKNVIQRSAALDPELIGITIEDSGDILVSENLIEGGGGVWISQSFVRMMTNTIRKNWAGVYIEGSRVSLGDNQIEQNGYGVAVTSRPQTVVWLRGNRITQQEYIGLIVESLGYIAECRSNQIRANKESDYSVQSPVISFFGEPKRDPAAEEKLRQQCEGN
jgi:nitrous oxidase accessory protein NosD